ncbi:hypothetical protein B1J93_15905 [Leptospira kirschneri serovar Pomona]|uniref:Uncharacterized protein n=1 Tax=Leptospira kirschneri serovar Pomona TaxID=561005 RepID=A0A1T1DIP5_9LEPT|nr:hypothetical protein B1J93_15905 [Leptospira kirschneri serovar Pomona]
MLLFLVLSISDSTRNYNRIVLLFQKNFFRNVIVLTNIRANVFYNVIVPTNIRANIFYDVIVPTFLRILV